MPKVSVITPAYNAAATIGRTIASVQAQTFADWEHIIIDDGSTDDTRAAVDAVRDSRLCYHYQPNQGPGHARNVGSQISNGEYLIYLDADDWWSQNCLERLLAGFETMPCQSAAVYGDWKFVDGAGNLGKVHSNGFASGHPLRTLLFSTPFVLHSIMLTRSVWRSVGGYNTELTSLEDWEFWLRAALAGCQFRHVSGLVAYYNLQPDSRSGDIQQNLENTQIMLDRFWGREDIPDELLELKKSSYASAIVESCVGAMAAGDYELAFKSLDAAYSYDSNSIHSVDTYYRIAFANETHYGNGSVEQIENFSPGKALPRLEKVISYFENRQEVYSPDNVRLAKSAAYKAIGLIGYHERRHNLARQYLYRAIVTNAQDELFGATSLTLAKSCLPSGLVQLARDCRSKIQSMRLAI